MASTPAGHGLGTARFSLTCPVLARFLSSPCSPRLEDLDRSLATPVMVQGDRETPVPNWHTWMSSCSPRSPYGVRHGFRHCVGLVNQHFQTNEAETHHPNG